MNLDRMLHDYANRKTIINIDEVAVEKVIKKSKESFWIGETEKCVSWPEFIFQQLFYIKKIWWLLQGSILFILWALLKCAESNTYMERCMGIVAPIFVILILPELWKNTNSKSTEIEGAALFSLQKVITARLLIFGMFDLVLLTIFFSIGIASTEITVWEMLIQFVLPMIVTTCICLRLFSGCYEKGMLPSIVFSLMWLTIWTLIILREDVYSQVSIPIWISLIIITFLYMCYCIYRIIKNTENISILNLGVL